MYLSPPHRNIEHCQHSSTIPDAPLPAILLSERSNILADDHIALAVLLSVWRPCPAGIPHPFVFQALPYFLAL